MSGADAASACAALVVHERARGSLIRQISQNKPLAQTVAHVMVVSRKKYSCARIEDAPIAEPKMIPASNRAPDSKRRALVV
jgi:hypothetical protein